MVIVSHEPHYIREHCDRACVLQQGRLVAYDKVASALSSYDSLCSFRGTPAPQDRPQPTDAGQNL